MTFARQNTKNDKTHSTMIEAKTKNSKYVTHANSKTIAGFAKNQGTSQTITQICKTIWNEWDYRCNFEFHIGTPRSYEYATLEWSYFTNRKLFSKLEFHSNPSETVVRNLRNRSTNINVIIKWSKLIRHLSTESRQTRRQLLSGSLSKTETHYKSQRQPTWLVCDTNKITY